MVDPIAHCWATKIVVVGVVSIVCMAVKAVVKRDGKMAVNWVDLMVG